MQVKSAVQPQPSVASIHAKDRIDEHDALHGASVDQPAVEFADFHGGADRAGGNRRHRALHSLHPRIQRPRADAQPLLQHRGGPYFTGVFLYLLRNAVIPITAESAWRGPADMIAVTFYLLGIVPLLGLTLVDLNIIGRERTLHGKMAIHAGFVALFLIVGHIAMIFGMLDPAVLYAGAGMHSH
jgi:hypothetical protein